MLFQSHNNYKLSMNTSLFLDNNISQFIIRYGEDDPDRFPKKIKQKPISVSSDLEIKMHKKKIRRDIQDREMPSVQKKIRKSTMIPSLHTNTEERKDDRQYSRVPIQYMEERDSGNPADKIRGRVVYRGYAPKNTYFYFKTIKQLRFTVSGTGAKAEKDYRGQDIVFNSKFQSGNLNAAVRINSREYWLYMREDTNTHGLRQWYYFEARARKSCRVRLRIYRFTKRFSLYKLGMSPYVRTMQSQWRQEGEKIKYEYDTDQKCYYLEFEYNFQEHKQTYFATLPPYTYTMVNQYLQSIADHQKVSIRKIGMSLSGLDIHAVSLTNNKKHHNQTHKHKEELHRLTHSHGFGSHQKEAIVILSRTHPGETASNFALQNFISRVLQIEQLTQKYNFYIIPMINPDGVFLGNHRTGVLGQDLNRNFHALDIEYYPQIQAVQNYIISIQKRHKIAFLFDLHGHSAKKNIFAYGQQQQIGSNRYLLGRIIPKILSNQIDSFKYDHCVFKAAKEKKNTARVYFSNKNNINSITFEQSYGLLQNGCIGISNWRNFGTALADSLVAYLVFSSENLSKELTAYLSDEMSKQKVMNEKKKQKYREREELKQKLNNISKTEGNEQIISRSYIQLFKKTKMKEQTQVANDLRPKQQQNRSITSISEEEQLSSGDEDMEMTNNQLQIIKKQIIRVGTVNRQNYKRQLYSMADKKVELGQMFVADTQRLHHKHSSMVQRIFKFRSRQKTKQYDGLPAAQSYRQKRQSLQLPFIRK